MSKTFRLGSCLDVQFEYPIRFRSRRRGEAGFPVQLTKINPIIRLLLFLNGSTTPYPVNYGRFIAIFYSRDNAVHFLFVLRDDSLVLNAYQYSDDYEF